ncbi:MAG: hypothetical protein F4Y02_07900 [Chloroflexi bacterium]|nr:hypothetical protein [Chloroflexota bacterium]
MPALAGYLFLNWFNGTRYSLPRETGYHVVFRSAIAGVVLFFIARLIVVFANAYVPIVSECWKAIVPLDYSGTAAGTFVLAAILPLILNTLSRFGQFNSREKAAEAAGDQISLIIDQAMLEGRFVELSLASGKSYVGSPIQGTFGHRDGGDVALIPIASGYRDNDSRNLVMTTNYAPAIEDQLSDLALDDLKVAFPMRDIVSARLFDQELYASFLDDKKGGSS